MIGSGGARVSGIEANCTKNAGRLNGKEASANAFSFDGDEPVPTKPRNSVFDHNRELFLNPFAFSHESVIKLVKDFFNKFISFLGPSLPPKPR
jgi:hypothetical protein